MSPPGSTLLQDLVLSEDELNAAGAQRAAGGDLVDDTDEIGEELAGLVSEDGRSRNRVHLSFKVV